MKKFQIILIIFLASFIFIPKTYALSTTYNYEVVYSETNLQLQNQYATEIQLIKDYVINHGGIGSYQLASGDYLFMIRTDQIASNNINVQLVNVNPSGSGRSYYNSNQYGTSGAVGITITAYEQKYSINNGVVSPTNNASITGSNYTWYLDTSTCNPNNTDCTLYDNTHYFDTFDINDTFTFHLVDNTAGVPNGKNTPLLLSSYDNMVYVVGENVPYKHFFDNFNPYIEPSYTYNTEILDNGSAKIDFNFNNYATANDFGYEIYNYVSGEYYGITNPFGSYPNMIPYGNSFTITIPFDTAIYIRLYKYENDSRELIDQDVIDLNNIVFENPQDPYFKIIEQSENRIRGIFENTKDGYSCYYSNSNNNIVGVVICDEEQVNETFNFNGYINFYIEDSGGHTIYSRKVNVLGADNTPYIVYNVEKQDFYSVITWEVKNKNLDPNMQYRYSTNNGISFTTWQSVGTEYPNINIYSNTTAIIEISNSDNTTIYDSKAINVVENIQTIKTFNKSSSNLINIFNNMFNVNENILPKINEFWQQIKVTKAYLLIFIPIVSSLICGIIYLIRRK